MALYFVVRVGDLLLGILDRLGCGVRRTSLHPLHRHNIRTGALRYNSPNLIDPLHWV